MSSKFFSAFVSLAATAALLSACGMGKVPNGNVEKSDGGLAKCDGKVCIDYILASPSPSPSASPSSASAVGAPFSDFRVAETFEDGFLLKWAPNDPDELNLYVGGVKTDVKGKSEYRKTGLKSGASYKLELKGKMGDNVSHVVFTKATKGATTPSPTAEPTPQPTATPSSTFTVTGNVESGSQSLTGTKLQSGAEKLRFVASGVAAEPIRLEVEDETSCLWKVEGTEFPKAYLTMPKGRVYNVDFVQCGGVRLAEDLTLRS